MILLATLATVDASWLDTHSLYYTPVDRNALTPLFRYVVYLLYSLLNVHTVLQQLTRF